LRNVGLATIDDKSNWVTTGLVIRDRLRHWPAARPMLEIRCMIPVKNLPLGVERQ
jgi:hypothetical protein